MRNRVCQEARIPYALKGLKGEQSLVNDVILLILLLNIRNAVFF
jgi:hypothetical protein